MPIRQGTANLKRKFNGIVEVNFIRQGIVLIYKSITQFVSDYSTRVLADGGTVEALTNITTLAQNLRNSDLFERLTLLFIPSGVKASKAYVLIPEDGTGFLTVVRNTTATRFNSSMLLVDSAINVARVNYLTIAGNPFLLVEAQDTNESNFSEDFTNSFYTKVAITASVISAINPRGVLSSNKLIPSTLASQHFMSTSNNKKVLSVFAKANGYSTVILFFTVHDSFVVFDTLNGVILSTSGTVTGKIEPLANGHFRCSAITTLTTHTQSRVYVINGTTFADRNIAGNGVDGVNIFGHQTSDILTSYIPALSNSAITRNADVITRTPPTGTVKIISTFLDDTTQVLTTIPATYTAPEGLIKSIAMNNTL